jgi:hypothetical protein
MVLSSIPTTLRSTRSKRFCRPGGRVDGCSILPVDHFHGVQPSRSRDQVLPSRSGPLQEPPAIFGRLDLDKRSEGVHYQFQVIYDLTRVLSVFSVLFAVCTAICCNYIMIHRWRSDRHDLTALAALDFARAGSRNAPTRAAGSNFLVCMLMRKGALHTANITNLTR